MIEKRDGKIHKKSTKKVTQKSTKKNAKNERKKRGRKPLIPVTFRFSDFGPKMSFRKSLSSFAGL